jgi:hypothetical protein
MRELQHSLRGQKTMILLLVWFFAGAHIKNMDFCNSLSKRGRKGAGDFL